ncbi:hypothetical protein BV921_14915 [Pectobacterium odoriferum]|nr:hypothetical protein BCS7_20885 [Pectobacterium odoriferum]TAI86198.1 hypothetical protein EG330_07985 [Pectobacterium versatile]POD92226.1 hypothetical protein BV925_11390 [Pectobacterium odoriferum]POE08853.1 hypothetical protein BV921_14915 [Pectobacterium odoriferum]POE16509.1 hypothetical protein BV918_16360 [Pectobacterium odoriferum]
MKKNEIYIDILQVTLPHLRMIASSSFLHRLRDRSAVYETQLIHGFYSLLSHEEFKDDDIRFLNHHCRYYYENCNSKISMLYNDHLKSFSDLFSIVPENFKDKLEWKGPEII